MDLKELKENFGKLGKKYKLPSFEEINGDFEIDKIERESDALLRSVRKTMMDKVVNSLGFLEMLLNPMNVPRMYLPFVRSMTQEDKKVIDEVYEALSELSMRSLECEVDYSEKKEAELIKDICKRWLESKEGFRKIFIKIRKPSSNSNNKKERSYFG